MRRLERLHHSGISTPDFGFSGAAGGGVCTGDVFGFFFSGALAFARALDRMLG